MFAYNRSSNNEPKIPYSPSWSQAANNIFVSGLKTGLMSYALVHTASYVGLIRTVVQINPSIYILSSVSRNAVLESFRLSCWAGVKILGDRKEFETGNAVTNFAILRNYTWKAIGVAEKVSTYILLKIDFVYSFVFRIRKAEDVNGLVNCQLHTTELMRRIFLPSLKNHIIGLVSMRIGIRTAKRMLKSTVVSIFPDTITFHAISFGVDIVMTIVNLFRNQLKQLYKESEEESRELSAALTIYINLNREILNGLKNREDMEGLSDVETDQIKKLSLLKAKLNVCAANWQSFYDKWILYPRYMRLDTQYQISQMIIFTKEYDSLIKESPVS